MKITTLTLKNGLVAGLLAASTWAGEVGDVAMGYTLTLPTGWVQIKTKETQHHFKDTTKQYKSVISIVISGVDNAVYPDARSWTQAQFIGYRLAVETTQFPFGAMLYFDSSSTAKLGDHWAPESFSHFFPGDGSPTYGEYIRFIGNGNYGYEIYAIGDSTDITSKADTYASIIATTKFSAATVALHRAAPGLRIRPSPSLSGAVFDLTGRKVFVPKSNPGQPGYPAMQPFRFLIRMEEY